MCGHPPVDLRVLCTRHAFLDGARMERSGRLCTINPRPFLPRAHTRVALTTFRRRLRSADPLLLHEEREAVEYIFVLPVLRNRFHFPMTDSLHRRHYFLKVFWISDWNIVR